MKGKSSAVGTMYYGFSYPCSKPYLRQLICVDFMGLISMLDWKCEICNTGNAGDFLRMLLLFCFMPHTYPTACLLYSQDYYNPLSHYMNIHTLTQVETDMYCTQIYIWSSSLEVTLSCCLCISSVLALVRF